MLIRPVVPEDAAAIAAIYGHYVRETAVTFACQEPAAAYFAAQIAQGQHPFLVAEAEGCVIGFAYAGVFRTKEAFRWGTELTIYLTPDHLGCSVGSRLMQALLALLRRQGYLMAYSCITLPNPRSISLHKRFGFEELGVFPRTGYKLGRWHDVIWLQLTLGEQGDSPAEPIPFRKLNECEIRHILASK